MAAIRRQVKMPFYNPTFRWMLEIGMFVLRQESELILKSRWVAPELLVDAGFKFQWTDLDKTLADLI